MGGWVRGVGPVFQPIREGCDSGRGGCLVHVLKEGTKFSTY